MDEPFGATVTGAHLAEIGLGGSRARAEALDGADFNAVYRRWFRPACTWIRALGCPEAEIEDAAQEVFLVVRRRLPEFDGRSASAWIYAIARRITARQRRRAWYRRRILGHDDTVLCAQVASGDGPVEALEQRQKRALVDRLVARMSEKRRVVFMLFEIEGWSGQEIADLLDIPLKTAWTRLHHARLDFHRHVQALDEREWPWPRPAGSGAGEGA